MRMYTEHWKRDHVVWCEEINILSFRRYSLWRNKKDQAPTAGILDSGVQCKGIWVLLWRWPSDEKTDAVKTK